MADPRFFQRQGPFALGTLAERIGARLGPDAPADRMVHDVAGLDQAGPDDLSFLDSRRWADRFDTSAAGVVIVPPGTEAPGRTLLLAERPQLAFARAAALFYPEPMPSVGIDASARIDPAARVGADCRIEPGAVIGAGAEIGPGSWIGPHAVIGAGVRLGAGARIGALVSISHALIGDRFVAKPGARIGQPGFGLVPGPEGLVRVPQLGRVIIADDVEVGANSTVDRGAGGDTMIGQGTMIDNLVQVAHNVVIGRGCILAGQVGISGSCRIDDYSMLGGQAGLRDHVRLGKGARVAAQSGVARDVDPGMEVGGSPAVPVRDWHRQQLTLAKLARKKGD